MYVYDYQLQRRKAGVIAFGDAITPNRYAYIKENLIDISLDYSMNLASMLSFSVIDPSLDLFRNNYFQVGQLVTYEGISFSSFNDPGTNPKYRQFYEIATVNLSQGPGADPVFSITCYPQAIQQMRRDKKPKNIKGSGSQYAKRAAEKYGLKFYGENTSKRKQINSGSADKQSESVWNVIEGIAGEAEFVFYEVDGYFIFASQKWLLKKWGRESITRSNGKSENFISVFYKPDLRRSRPFPPKESEITLLNYPNISIQENAPFDVEGSMTVDRTNGVRLRPGMTIKLSDFGNFDGYYLIDNVSFDELSPDPVTVSFRSPQVQEKEIKQLPVGKIRKTNPVVGKDRKSQKKVNELRKKEEKKQKKNRR
jgi:hypothetical protein